MKSLMFSLIGMIFSLCFSLNVFAAEGKSLFQELKCYTCHHQKEEGFAPSLKEISKNYKNKKEMLVKYLKGENKAIVDPEREDFMKPYINQTKKLENKDLQSLADYLLSF